MIGPHIVPYASHPASKITLESPDRLGLDTDFSQPPNRPPKSRRASASDQDPRKERNDPTELRGTGVSGVQWQDLQ
jgi:hypothetical protein